MSRLARGFALALTAVTAVWLLPAPGAEASYPGANGRIAFVHLGGGSHASQDIFSMDPSGRHRVRLTKSAANDAFPSFSGDGRRIAFSRGGDTGRGQIWIMDADGRHAKRLTAGLPAGEDRDPYLSPDGRWIAFTREIAGVAQIWAMNADGSEQRQMTFPATDGQDAFGPAISPDGESIAFSRLDPASGFREIAVINADGANLRSLTTARAENDAYQPDWSPDGRRIVFDSFDQTEDDLALVPLDGSGQMALTSGDDLDFDPAFAPNGRTVALERNAADFSFANILRVDAAGLNRHLIALTHNEAPVQDFEPAWQAAPRE